MDNAGNPNRKAIVIGASMAGLLAARALADYFDQVVLVEKDTFPAPGKNRKGVPQDRHVHALLDRGRVIMEEYLPGLTEELVHLGAVDVRDASGRGSHSPEWLENLGYQRPEEEELRVGIGYTTCFYRREPEHLPGLNGMLILAKPSTKRFGIILGVDGNRWIVTMGGYRGNHAPGDYPGFLKYAGELPVPHIYDVIKDAEPLTDLATYKFSANLRRHYEKLARFPEGYLVLGDAMCSFNPVYGQGMTVAAIEAKALGECLVEGTEKLSKRFFVKAGRIIETPWSLTIGNDLSFPEVPGRRTVMMRFINWYVDKLHHTACKDSEVSIAFLKVIHMMTPPPGILHPRIAWRILKDHLLAAGIDSGYDVPENLNTLELIR